MGFFQKLKDGLSKTRDRLFGGLRSVLTLGRRIDEDLLEEMEEVLLLADVGPRTTEDILEAVRAGWKRGDLKQTDDLVPFLKSMIAERLRIGDTALARAPSGPTVVLVCGVNGSGKTTSIGKLTKWLRDQGNVVILGAADTFRAAAVEQLTIWSERNGVQIVKQATGADPAAVAFDACQAGAARGADYVIIDTAGRLHTQENLMAELEKIKRVAGKAIPGAPHEVLLVLDATTGQNAVRQAELFHDVAGVTGLFVSKLDGTAKGGAVLAIRDTIGVPVKFIGLGEKIDDVEPFDPEKFAAALFG
jgi:fused signal recognition particle receptor